MTRQRCINIHSIHDISTNVKRNLTHINEVSLEYNGDCDKYDDSADFYAEKPVKAVRLG